MANTRLYGATDAADVTPNDTVDSTTAIKSTKAHGDENPVGFMVGGSGDIVLQMVSGNQVTLPNVAAGVSHAFQFTHVLATGTAATEIKALFQ